MFAQQDGAIFSTFRKLPHTVLSANHNTPIPLWRSEQYSVPVVENVLRDYAALMALWLSS